MTAAINPEFIYTELQIHAIQETVKDFKIFSFEAGHGLTYQSGQFITLIDLSVQPEIRRSYSIVSSPAVDELLSIAVKRIDNGQFSRKLVDHARVGDKLYCSGVAGFFRLPESLQPYDSIILFAAGSGIAPVYSLIKTILHFHPAIGVKLIYSSQSEEQTAFYEALKLLQHNFARQLQIHFLFSSLSDLRRARLNRDLLLELLTMHNRDHERTLFYTCGPDNYMQMILFFLLEEGFPKTHIRKEDFTPRLKKPKTHLPPDRNNYEVYLKWGAEVFDFPVHYPDSILQAAKKSGIQLPYSCETGKCGSCAVRCIAGMVWLSYNEVLTEKDLAQGLTLTCTGHPQNGDVRLELP